MAISHILIENVGVITFHLLKGKGDGHPSYPYKECGGRSPPISLKGRGVATSHILMENVGAISSHPLKGKGDGHLSYHYRECVTKEKHTKSKEKQ